MDLVLKAEGPAAMVAMVVGLLWAGPSLASATLQVQADASASASDDYVDSESPPTDDSGVVPIGSLPASASATQGASARARYAQANASSAGEVLLQAPGSFSGALVFCSGSAWAYAPGGGQNPQVAVASGRVGIIYDDVLTAGGVAPGTPVELLVRLELNGQINHQGTNRAATVELDFGDPGFPSGPIVGIVDADQNGAFAESTGVPLVVVAGSPFDIELKLLQTVDSGANYPGDGLGYASTDFMYSPHRGVLHIDVLTPGASYVLESGADLRSASTVSVSQAMGDAPLFLSEPSPNPARGPVHLDLMIPPGGARGRVSVIDASGRLVWRSTEQRWTAGRRSLAWSGLDSHGRPTPSGLFLLRVDSDRGSGMARVVRIR